MNNYTKEKTRKLAELYLRGKNNNAVIDLSENLLIELSEINPEYHELFPMIKEVMDDIFRDKIERIKEGHESEKEVLKEEYNQLNNKLEEIRKIYLNLHKNKIDLSSLLK
jgi:hypothetical protein